MFGPVLSVHDGHGYTFRVLPTGNTLQGRTSVGVYFCADWCGPCTSFTPILKNYYTAQRASRAQNKDGTLELVLVSRCRTARDTEQLFSTMPWTAMPHVDSVGKRGNDLMAAFGVTTIPALIFLDSLGAITCQDGRDEVVRQQAAANRSTATARPVSRLQAEATYRSVSVVSSKDESIINVRPQAGQAPGAVIRQQAAANRSTATARPVPQPQAEATDRTVTV